ncbi:MAG: hypothetical protein MZW92_81115 [Comamonadaceae bacterium]|nr:hypothetical protein [Comamonadaceae bacterium]
MRTAVSAAWPACRRRRLESIQYSGAPAPPTAVLRPPMPLRRRLHRRCVAALLRRPALRRAWPTTPPTCSACWTPASPSAALCSAPRRARDAARATPQVRFLRGVVLLDLRRDAEALRGLRAH